MSNSESTKDNIFGEIGWESVLESDLFDGEFDFCCPESGGGLSVGDIEEFLMEDEKIGALGDGFCEEYLDQMLVDSFPVEVCSGSDGNGLVLEEKESISENNAAAADVSYGNNNKNNSIVNEESNGDEEKESDDPDSRKLKRKLRNKDAAMKSRERKKMYVKDLEIKSRYFEGECKRLGMLFQCVLAENQALRFSLQNSKAFDASMAKQESAVLLMESLLLGSLLWFLGIMCLLILPEPLRSTPKPVQLENRRQGGLAPKRERNEYFELVKFQSFMTSKRCKGSRSRMKPNFLALEILV